MKKAVVFLVILFLGLAGGYYYINSQNTARGSIKVLAAGSLSIPLKELANRFQEKYGIKVYIETSGSIETVKKVSELGIKADVVAVADYKAIESYLMPNYTNWYIKFASNEMVIAYTNHSKFANEINSTNWMKILSKKDVRIGFSSPNDDPCGYRAVMMFYLTQLKYHNGIFNDIILNNTGIKFENGVIVVPNDAKLLGSTGKIFIKRKSVDLLSDLQAGDIDYAIEYLSVAKQHHINYLKLPPEINLSNSTLISWYSKAVVKLADGRVMHGDAINYGVTIPNNAPNKEFAYQFVNMLLSKEGREILENCGQKPIFIPVGQVPEEVKP